MKCPWCTSKADIKQFNKRNVDEHLLILVDPDNHYHIHAPFESKRTINDMLMFLVKEVNKRGYNYQLSLKKPLTQLPNKKEKIVEAEIEQGNKEHS